MPHEEDPKEIEIDGKKYPVTSVERGPQGDIRTITFKGTPKFKKKVPVYPYRIRSAP